MASCFPQFTLNTVVPLILLNCKSHLFLLCLLRPHSVAESWSWQQPARPHLLRGSPVSSLTPATLPFLDHRAGTSPLDVGTHCALCWSHSSPSSILTQVVHFEVVCLAALFHINHNCIGFLDSLKKIDILLYYLFITCNLLLEFCFCPSFRLAHGSLPPFLYVSTFP